MTLNEVKEQLERLDNELEYKLKEKEILFQKTQPQAVDTTKENVEGGTRSDKYLNYVETLEEKNINVEIDKLYQRRRNLENWLNNELKILGKYNEIEQLVRYYKEEVQIVDKYTRRSRGLTWKEIGEEIHYSPVWCRKVYKLYKMKRDI